MVKEGDRVVIVDNAYDDDVKDLDPGPTFKGRVGVVTLASVTKDDNTPMYMVELDHGFYGNSTWAFVEGEIELVE